MWGDVVGSKTGAGSLRGELEHLVAPESGDVLREQKDQGRPVEGTQQRDQLERAPSGQT